MLIDLWLPFLIFSIVMALLLFTVGWLFFVVGREATGMLIRANINKITSLLIGAVVYCGFRPVNSRSYRFGVYSG
jgi:hypothetical protein